MRAKFQINFWLINWVKSDNLDSDSTVTVTFNIQDKNQIREETKMPVIKPHPDTDIVTFSSRLQNKDQKQMLYISPNKESTQHHHKKKTFRVTC